MLWQERQQSGHHALTLVLPVQKIVWHEPRLVLCNALLIWINLLMLSRSQWSGWLHCKWQCQFAGVP